MDIFERVRRGYRALGLGADADVLAMLDQDGPEPACWEIHSLDIRRVRSRPAREVAALDLFGGFPVAVRADRRAAEVLGAERTSRAPGRGRQYRLRLRGTAETLDIPFSHYWSFKDGRVKEVRNLTEGYELRRRPVGRVPRRLSPSAPGRATRAVLVQLHSREARRALRAGPPASSIAWSDALAVRLPGAGVALRACVASRVTPSSAQAPPQSQPRPADARAHGAERHVQGLGDLRVAEVVPRHEQQGVAIGLRDAVQRLGEGRAQQGCFGPAHRRVRVVLARPDVEPLQRAPASLASAQVVADEVGGQAEEPRARVGAVQVVGRRAGRRPA